MRPSVFIWLNTIINFIVADEANINAVDEILGLTSSSEAEGELDVLYRTVIETACRSKTSSDIVPMIIGIILASAKTTPLSATAIYSFLPLSFALPFPVFDVILKRLSAILHLNDDGITVVHTSVLDFFGDKSRCGGGNWIDPVEIQRIMASGCFEIMKRGSRGHSRLSTLPPGLRFNMCSLLNSHLRNDEVPDLQQRIAKNITPELRYSCVFWADHLAGSRLHEGTEGNISVLASGFICSVMSLYWIEAMTLFGSVLIARDALFRVSALEEV